ncbi:MAG: hypothetical protein JW783_08370 [Bacteroidales bacterium]|nr:hypothetical protein [Bacteroidales bacterium]MBN2749956.1 hypothetical protein [Bacteroidales bacterium]
MKKGSKEAKAISLVEKFNKLYPVGSTVTLRKIAISSSPYLEYTVRHEAFVANGLDPVAFFDGISGYFSIEPDFVKYPS